MEKWEYISTRVEVSSGGFLDILYDNKINELGEQGWELVSFFITNRKQDIVKFQYQFLREEYNYIIKTSKQIQVKKNP